MEELVNTAIQKYCILLARRHGIKDLSRVQAIVERTLINYDYEKFGHKMGLWNGSQTSKLLKSSLQVLNYFPPLCIDFLRNYRPEHLKLALKDKSIIDLLIKLFKFSPSLEEALNYLPNEAAFDLFEKEDLSFLSQKENFIKEITKDYIPFYTKGYLPFYTLDELVNVLEDFIFQQKQDSEFIIKTGYPSHAFYKHTLLDNLSRCYYIRCPERIEFYNPSVSTSYPEAWIRYSKSKFWDLISLMPSQMSSAKNVLLKYTWEGGSYEEAPLIEGISLEEAKLLEKSRFMVFEYKLRILNSILQSLKNKDASALWKNCFNIFLNSFEEVFPFFMKMDVFYERSKEKEVEAFLNIGEIGFPYRRVGRPYISGGIRNVFDAIKYFEKEIKIGTFSKTKTILNKLPENVSLISYYQSVNQPWQQTLDLAFKTFSQLYEKEMEFNREFFERLERDVGKSLKIDIPIEFKYLPVVSNFYRTIKLSEEISGIAFHMAPIITPPSVIKKRKKPIIPFPTPKGIKWGDVSIRFINNEEVQIRAGNIMQVRSYIDMDFEFRQKEQPDIIWETLREFAKFKEEISWKDKAIQKREIEKHKKRISTLRARLKSFFGLEKDPFFPYYESKSYRTRFNISMIKDLSGNMPEKQAHYLGADIIKNKDIRDVYEADIQKRELQHKPQINRRKKDNLE